MMSDQIRSTTHSNHLNLIPPDCTSKALSFLHLVDVLSYGSASLTSLRDVTRELGRRRKLLTETLVHTTPRTSPGTFRLASEEKVSSRQLSSSPSLQCDEKSASPSVYDRIVLLHQSLPSSHRLRTPVRLLLEDLKAAAVGGEEVQNSRDGTTLASTGPSSCDADPTKHDSGEDRRKVFREALLELRRRSRAHRLHALVLTSVVGGCHHHEESGNGGSVWAETAARTSGDETALVAPTDNSMRLQAVKKSLTAENSDGGSEGDFSVALDDYIGDVLCACFLVGHAAAGIVEGGPSEQFWMDIILEATVSSGGNTVGSAKSWYSTWVFMHSALLRTAPFTRRQRVSLGLESPSCGEAKAQSTRGEGREEGGGVEAATASAEESHRIVPDVLFAGVEKHSFLFAMRPHLTFMDFDRRAAALKIILNDFGPLGPTFRGRDRIRTVVVPLSTVWSALQPYDALLWARGQPSVTAEYPSLLQHISGWFEGTHAGIRWILEAHAEATKARPMTVARPAVSILLRAAH